MADFTWGAGGAQMTPERIASQRRVADAMMARGMDYSPVRSPWQGAARVAEAIVGNLQNYQADQAERTNMVADANTIREIVQQMNGPPVQGADSSRPATTLVGDNPAYTPRGIRNNNPLNIEAGTFTSGQPGFAGSDGRFAKFDTPEAGVGAAGKLLDVYRDKHGLNTVNGIVGRWAPAADGNNVSAYAANVSKQLGIGPDDPIPPEMRPQLIAAMGQHENGRPIQVASLAPNAGVPATAAPAVSPGVTAVAAAHPRVNPGLLAAMASPYTSDATKRIAGIVLQNQLQGDAVTTVDLGNEVGVMDKRGNIVRRLPKGEPNKGPTYGVIRKDAFGNEEYGWINPRDQSIKPTADAAPQPPGPITVTGIDGKPIPVPPGQDPKKFREHVTTATADAAVGKKTEVQAKDEKFANKMELAERNLADGLDANEGTSLSGRMKEGSPYAPGTSTVGNYFQTDNYQKYKQARDNFITALLRDESGAAIGTQEFNRYEKELFPQPGDGKDVIEQKREARRVAIEAMKKGAGPGYKPPTMPAAAGDVPPGIDPKVWKAMTPEERALWK